MTVCLLVLGQWSGTPSVLSLPLQSRISLRSAVRDLRNLGFGVEFALASHVPATSLRRAVHPRAAADGVPGLLRYDAITCVSRGDESCEAALTVGGRR